MPVTSRPPSRKDSSRSRPGSRGVSRQGSVLSTASTITSVSKALTRSGSTATGSRVTLLAEEEKEASDEVDLKEELISQLGAELAGCSRQRMRLMRMSLRRAANMDLRISTKDLSSLLQV